MGADIELRESSFIPSISLFVGDKLPLLLLLLLLQFNEWYQPDCMLDFPIGGSQAMVQALIR
jgi:hypothetical protein